MPQDTGLPAGMSAVDYLNWYAALYGIPACERKQRVKDLLSEVDLSDKRDENISELSGGMQKRVALARAIATQPEIIFFDEPTTGLDPIMAQVINDLIRELVVELALVKLTS